MDCECINTLFTIVVLTIKISNQTGWQVSFVEECIYIGTLLYLHLNNECLPVFDQDRFLY